MTDDRRFDAELTDGATPSELPVLPTRAELRNAQSRAMSKRSTPRTAGHSLAAPTSAGPTDPTLATDQALAGPGGPTWTTDPTLATDQALAGDHSLDGRAGVAPRVAAPGSVASGSDALTPAPGSVASGSAPPDSFAADPFHATPTFPPAEAATPPQSAPPTAPTPASITSAPLPWEALAAAEAAEQTEQQFDPVEPAAANEQGGHPDFDQTAIAEPTEVFVEPVSVEYVDEGVEPLPATPTKPPFRWRRVVLPLAAVLALLLAWAGFVGLQGYRAANALQNAAAELPALQRQMRDDPAAGGPTLARVQEQAEIAARATGGPIYGLATHLPFIGDDLGAVRIISATVHNLTTEVLPRLASAVEAVNPATLAPHDGRINLQPLIDVRPDVVAADDAVRESLENLWTINPNGLIGPIAEAHQRLAAELWDVSQATGTASRAVQLIPPMLGADGPREWIILTQTNAEPRALGGIVGSIIPITVDDGRVEKGTARFGRLGALEEPIIPLTDEEVELWGDLLGRHHQNITGVPDFPRSAELASAWWEAAADVVPTGVLSIDPVALQKIVEVTGDVEFTDPEGNPVTLSAENTAHFLLSEVYARYPDPRVQDAVFGEAAGAVFDRLTDGGFSAQRMITALDDAAAEGRLMVWSAVPAEQDLLYNTNLGGALRGQVMPEDGRLSPEVGVFFHLTTASKLGYYLRTSAVVEDVSYFEDLSQHFTLVVTIENTLTPEIAADLPDYVIGEAGRSGVNPFAMFLTAPYLGSFGDITDADGEMIGMRYARLGPLEVYPSRWEIGPGETMVFRISVFSGPGQFGDVRVRMTPGVS